MATLNGDEVNLVGMTDQQIADLLRDVSRHQDGRGVELTLTEEEAVSIGTTNGAVGATLRCLVIESAARVGKNMSGMSSEYNPATRTFKT